jgi:SAM-dependent methyltransferase
MESASERQLHSDEAFQYLCVDFFIQGFVDTYALKTAFEISLIDYLIATPNASLLQLQNGLQINGFGLSFLVDLLAANGVVKHRDGTIALTEPFMTALRYRDLLEAKIDFSNFAAPDVANLFSLLIAAPDQFSQSSRMFQLFDYSRCSQSSPESLEFARRWMRFTTILTRYESRVCMKYHDFSRYERMLDIGGNSGEFVLQICRRFPSLRATVFDLPPVCDVGEAHIRAEPEADRISFVRGSALADPLPTGSDLVSFKSMLHDWPEPDARRLLSRAARAVPPGGTLMIFERGQLEVGKGGLPYSLIPMLLFLNYFRPSSVYHSQLEAEGFLDITTQLIQLETPFFLVTARAPT